MLKSITVTLVKNRYEKGVIIKRGLPQIPTDCHGLPPDCHGIPPDCHGMPRIASRLPW